MRYGFNEEIDRALLEARRGIGWQRRPVPMHFRKPGGIADRAWRLARRRGGDYRRPGSSK